MRSGKQSLVRQAVDFGDMGHNLQPQIELDCFKTVKKVGGQVIAGSVFTLLVGFIAVPNLGSTGELEHFAHDTVPLLFCMTAWGLATGIGLLRAWRWARISMLIFGGLLDAAQAKGRAILAESIVAVPVAGVLRRFGWAAVLTAVILTECGVLALNLQHSFSSAMNSPTEVAEGPLRKIV